MASLIIHAAVKRVSFVVRLSGLKHFNVISPSLSFPCLENGADNIVLLEMADVT